ncbi:MAG: acetyl-CoA hydrolase/transferase family protein [Chloroflexota bacterium]
MTAGWAGALHSRICSADEAVRVVESGQRVFLHGAGAVPKALVSALVARAHELQDVEIVHLHTEGGAPYVAPEMAGHFRHRALFVGANTRQAVNEGRADYVPVFLSDIPQLFRGSLKIDVALLNLTTPDEHGYCSLGTSVDCALAAAESAATVVAQLNVAMPRTLGDGFVHVNRITRAVLHDEPPHEVVSAPPGEVEQAIGALVATLVEDGATIQIGIGGIPNAILAALATKRELGIHSEMIADGVLDLIEAGAVTGQHKTLDRGKVTTAFALGSRRLYEFIHNNPGVAMRPADYVNDARIICQHPKMVAMNSALQVDLTGQVAADSIGSFIYSGVGGQMDFVRGATLSPGGKAIIALPSTARGGTVSRIVPALTMGAGVVTTRAHVQYVVTEYGIANLHGLSLAERVHALTSIAHPAFREVLMRDWQSLFTAPG